MNTACEYLGLANLDELDFNKGGGLLPAVIQDADSGTVLMVGYMNREALEATLSRGRVVFFSRSKGRLWEKGETSGHTLQLGRIRVDCDGDTLLVTAWPTGATCHLGHRSCFGDYAWASAPGFLTQLEQIISDRIARQPQGSYTTKLLAAGRTRIAQKVGEEALEAALAGVGGTDEELIAETADLLYHVLVLLKARGLALEGVLSELQSRHTRAGTPS